MIVEHSRSSIIAAAHKRRHSVEPEPNTTGACAQCSSKGNKARMCTWQAVLPSQPVLANKRLSTLFWVWVSAGVRCRMGTNMGEWLQQQVKWVWVWVGFTVAEMNMGTIWVWVYTVSRHSKRPFDPSLPMFKGTVSPIASHTCTCCCAAAIARRRGESLSFRPDAVKSEVVPLKQMAD
eukprot:16989-Heterococcus_DN1.PRE.2